MSAAARRTCKQDKFSTATWGSATFVKLYNMCFGGYTLIQFPDFIFDVTIFCLNRLGRGGIEVVYDAAIQKCQNPPKNPDGTELGSTSQSHLLRQTGQ